MAPSIFFRLLSFLVVAVSAGVVTAQEALVVPVHIAEFVEINCLDCHEGESAKGKMDLAV